MFNRPRKSLTPGSSKSVSPVPLEFAEEFEIRTDPEIIYSENVFNDSNDQEADNLQSSAYNGDTTLNPGIQYEYTNNHPMGKILLKMLQDNTQLAKKSGVKMMELGVDDLCKNFYNAQLMERNILKSRILQTTADMEMSIIEREMNSHTINQQVTAPSSFSSAPTLLTPR